MSTFSSTIEVWRVFEDLYSTGKVKQLGISNCYGLSTLKNLYEMAKVKPSVVQNRFYAETGYDKEIRSFCRYNNIIYQSFWTLTGI
jgi:diketogulonate reductase-like aldo/keto reductase